MLVRVALPEPFMFLVIDPGLVPGIAVQVTDAPHIAHRVARSCRLGMERRSRPGSQICGNRPPAADDDAADRRTTFRGN